MAKKENVRRCQNCQGNGRIHKEVKPGVWEWHSCPARCKNGKIVISTI